LIARSHGKVWPVRPSSRGRWGRVHTKGSGGAISGTT
jgi:hypothetical protein